MTSERDDAALLLAISKNRDREAFAELYRRHAQAGLNLALYITNNRESAEEALQEALLRVWRSATPVTGNGRAWVLRIVVHEALRAIRKNRKGKAVQATYAEPAAPRVDAQIEHSELLAGLNSVLEKLPQLERKLVVMSFAGGLSQDEIADSLSMPQQTVSYKLAEALKQLKRSLTELGFAAALPLVSAEGIVEALSAKPAAAPPLNLALLDRIQSDARKSMRRATTKSGKSAIVWSTGVFAVAIAASGLWYATAKQPTATVAPPPVSKAPADDGWRNVAVSPIVKFHSEIPANDIALKAIPDGDGEWKVSQNAGGTQIEQVNPRVTGAQYITVGELVSGACEWSADVEEPAAGIAGYMALLPPVENKIIGLHLAQNGTAPLRIVSWPIHKGVRVVSIRKLQDKLSVGMQTLVTPDGTFNIGFFTSSTLTIRNLRWRSLPKDWKPELDPELKKLGPAVFKTEAER